VYRSITAQERFIDPSPLKKQQQFWYLSLKPFEMFFISGKEHIFPISNDSMRPSVMNILLTIISKEIFLDNLVAAMFTGKFFHTSTFWSSPHALSFLKINRLMAPQSLTYSPQSSIYFQVTFHKKL
jgi:hypothetical protein